MNAFSLHWSFARKTMSDSISIQYIYLLDRDIVTDGHKMQIQLFEETLKLHIRIQMRNIKRG